MEVRLDPNSIEDYRLFLKIKQLPTYRIAGRMASFPDEYAARLQLACQQAPAVPYDPIPGLFDYQRDIARLATWKRRFAVFAECLAGESIINSPDGDITVADAHAHGTAMRVFAIKSGRVVIAKASAPFINGVERLFRFTLASGRSITATKGHRFLTPSGWKCGELLRIGEHLAASDANHLRSTLEPDQLGCAEGVPHSTRKPQDWMGRCSSCSRQYGEPLPPVAGIALGVPPSPDDVAVHTPRKLRMDGRGTISGCTHLHRPERHLSIARFAPQVVTTEGVAECQLPSCDPSCSRMSSRTSAQAGEETTLATQESELPPSGESLNADDPCGPCQDSLMHWDTLVAVNYIRTDVFYDMEVPGPANYLADGVWSHNCGLGKTLIMTEFARHAAALIGDKNALIVSPLMVIEQTLGEIERFYGWRLRVEQVHAADLQGWLDAGGNRIGITNYEAMKESLTPGKLGAMLLDEASMLKSHYGKWGTKCIELGRGLEWKLSLTGTPAPNDRIEYANQAVFLDQFPTVNSFLAKYFVNRGQTSERWELRKHALGHFYRALSHWCIFLSNPATYGWKDNVANIPPIEIHIERVDLTEEQHRLAQEETGMLFAGRFGGITKRSTLGRLGKGKYKGKDIGSLKPAHIVKSIASWPEESTLVWCLYNDEQEELAKLIPGAANITGGTPHAERMKLIADFKSGKRKVLISKPKILGFGLNLQMATRQIFSGLQDSYESFYQAVKRSNRIGSTRPLNVHIPVTDLEEPMVENVLRKAKRVQQDTDEQERIFKESSPFGE